MSDRLDAELLPELPRDATTKAETPLNHLNTPPKSAIQIRANTTLQFQQLQLPNYSPLERAKHRGRGLVFRQMVCDPLLVGVLLKQLAESKSVLAFGQRYGRIAVLGG